MNIHDVNYEPTVQDISQYILYITQLTIHIIHYTINSTHYTLYITQLTVDIIHYTINNTHYTNTLHN